MENEMKDCGIKNSHLPTVKEIIAANASFEQGLYQKEYYPFRATIVSTGSKQL